MRSEDPQHRSSALRSAAFRGALLCLALAAAGPAIAADRILEQRVEAGVVEGIVLHGGDGNATIVPGDGDRIEIRVRLSPKRWTDDEAWHKVKSWFLTSAYENVDELMESMAIDLSKSSSRELGIRLQPYFRGEESRVSEEWTITVPRRLAVEIVMNTADIEVSGVAGGVDLKDGVGSVRVDVPEGDVDVVMQVGDVELRTASPSIDRVELRSQVGKTKLWMKGMRIEYPSPPGPGSRVSMNGEGRDEVRVRVQVGDASVWVDEPEG